MTPDTFFAGTDFPYTGMCMAHCFVDVDWSVSLFEKTHNYNHEFVFCFTFLFDLMTLNVSIYNFLQPSRVVNLGQDR